MTCMTGKRIALGTLILALIAVALSALVAVFLDRTARADFLLAASVGGFVLLVGAALLLVNESTSSSTGVVPHPMPAFNGMRQSESQLRDRVDERIAEARRGGPLPGPALMLVLAGLLILLCSFIAGQAVRLLW